MAERKTFRGTIELKADADTTGQFMAEFATLDVIDHDGDVTTPGAFTDGQETMIEAWNHNYGILPVGKGVIHEGDGKASIDGRFFLDTQGGLEHYRVVKALGALQEWSYTFSIEEQSFGKFEEREVRFLRKLDVWGVAPVERGAGIGTGTVAIKGAGGPRPYGEDDREEKGALGSHSTATTDEAWDGPANVARARSGENEAYYRRIFAWMDPDGDPAVKSTYKFPHHMVSGDGAPGAANMRGCSATIAVLNGGRGGSSIPDGDRRGVYNHVARHLRDGEMEVPDLKGDSSPRSSGVRNDREADGEGADGDEGMPQGTAGAKSSGPRPSIVRVIAEADLLGLGS